MNNEMTGIALAVGLLWGGIAFAVLPEAIVKSSDNDKMLVIEHKLSLIDEQIDDYEQSEQYQTIKAANESLKRIKG